MVYKVRIEPVGIEIEVNDDETILTAALRQAVTLAYSCRSGLCGTCKGRLLSGDIDYGQYQEKAMSAGEREQGHALFCQAKPLSDCVIEASLIDAVADIEIRTLPCRVAKMDKLADDVMRLYLKLPEDDRLQFLAGQYINILLGDGRVRSFSLANPPHDDALLELHIRHVPGGVFTGRVFNAMQEKDILRFRGPLGTFFLRAESNRPIIMMAGGTGFAPIKGILEHAFTAGFAQVIHLYWGVRTKCDLYHQALATAWAEQYENFTFIPVLSEPQVGDDWQGRTGWVHEAVVEDFPDLGGFDVYASGPPPMIAAGKTVFAASGLPKDNLYYDAFDFSHDKNQ